MKIAARIAFFSILLLLVVNFIPFSAASANEILIDDDAILGDPNAPVVMIEWGDYEGPFCGRFYDQTFQQINETYIQTGKVQFIYRDFPLSFHPNAQKAAEAAECAGEQDAYFAMHNKIFESGVFSDVNSYRKYAQEIGLNDTDAFMDCLRNGDMENEVQKDFDDGQNEGIQGTPGFIINGEIVSGALPFEDFQAIIELKINESQNKTENETVINDPLGLIDDDAIFGDPNAPITMVEWGNYEGPFCRRFYDRTFYRIDEEYIQTGKVRFIFRDFPLSYHTNAQKAAEAAECAGEQGKYFEMYNVLFQEGVSSDLNDYRVYAEDIELGDVDAFMECLTSGAMESEVLKDFADGQAQGVQGIPSFYIDDVLVSGALPFEDFKAIIDEKLNISEDENHSTESIPLINWILPEDNITIYRSFGLFAINYSKQDIDEIRLEVYDPNDRPTVELFVMSNGPYATQAEKGLIPVLKLLGNKVDWHLRFTYYAMHGEDEVIQQTIQYCIQKEEKEKLLDYLTCYLNDADTENCLIETNVDLTKLENCIIEADETFAISENLYDDSLWLEGRFPQFPIDKRLNEQYGVKGSPTLVINGEIVESARDSNSYLNEICNAFANKPKECTYSISDEVPEVGFGEFSYDVNTLIEGLMTGCPRGINQVCIFEVDFRKYVNRTVNYYFLFKDTEQNYNRSEVRSITYSDNCIPNWVEKFSTCRFDESQEGYFVDANECYAITNNDWYLENIPENRTHNYSCDYNGDGFVGNLSQVKTNLGNVSFVHENNSFSFKTNNETKVAFQFNLSSGVINFNEIIIDTQDNESSFGYLLIKGLNLTAQNQTKTVYVDKVSTTANRICIKDDEVLTISEVSDQCTGENEISLVCPGVSGSYACNVTNNGTQYVISGLQHSAVKEYTYVAPSVPTNNNGGGGSGGGGGGGSSSTNVENINNTESLDDTGSIVSQTQNDSIDNTFTEETQEDKNLFERIFGFTGAAIGSQRNGSLLFVIVILLILGGVGVFVWKKRNQLKK